MPAFTFEKISPPVRRGPIPPIVKKQRGLILRRHLRIDGWSSLLMQRAM